MALEIEAYEATEAGKRMHGGVRIDLKANLPQGLTDGQRAALALASEKGQAREKAAAATGASARNVQDAKKLAKEATL